MGTAVAVAALLLGPAVRGSGSPAVVSAGERQGEVPLADPDPAGGPGGHYDLTEVPKAQPSGGQLAWYNTTANMSQSTSYPKVTSGGLSFDPILGAMVLFGGCGRPCPANATWEYNGYEWENVTSALASQPGGLPPALQGFGIAWDPLWEGVLLTGGVLANGSVSNQTWLLNQSGWVDLTPSVDNPANGSLAAPSSAYGTLAYDGNLSAMVAVNGCSTLSGGCGAGLAGETFALRGPGSTWSDLGSGFAPGASYPGSAGQGGWGAQMSYDPTDQRLVYFGGEDATGHVENYTWTMNATGWSNVTAASTGCYYVLTVLHCYYPAATAFGAMTWDGELNATLLVAGENASHGPTGVTSNYTNGAWYPNCAVVCLQGSPAAESHGEMAANSSDVAPLLLAGSCAAACAGDAYVYEISPLPSVDRAAPNPSEVGVPVVLNATKALGTGSGPFLYDTVYDEGRLATVTVSSGVTFSTPVRFGGSFTYATPGTYVVQAGEVDWFYISGYSSTVDVVVNPALGVSSVSAGLPPATEGTPVTFHVTVAYGVPGYRYAWTFGDGGTASVASPTHTYRSPGTYLVTVVVNDSLGVSDSRSMLLAVGGASSTGATLSGLLSEPWFDALIAAIIAVGGVLAILLLRRPPPVVEETAATAGAKAGVPGAVPVSPPEPAPGGSPGGGSEPGPEGGGPASSSPPPGSREP